MLWLFSYKYPSKPSLVNIFLNNSKAVLITSLRMKQNGYFTFQMIINLLGYTMPWMCFVWDNNYFQKS